MTTISREYHFNLKYDYDASRMSVCGMQGSMKGIAVRYEDNKFFGMVNSARPIMNDSAPYLAGAFHSQGLSFINFYSSGSIQTPILWAFEKREERYTGAWGPINEDLITYILKNAHNLQEVVSRYSDSVPMSFWDGNFRSLLASANQSGLFATLELKNAQTGRVRHALGLAR